MKDEQRRESKGKRRFGGWKLMVSAALGLLLGLAGVLFLTRVHNPFGAELRTPLALMPDDVDFVIDVPSFPRAVRELPNEPFVERLVAHEGFRRFRRSPLMQRTEIERTLRDAFAEIESIDQRLPMDLRLLGDVSGERVVLGGFEEGIHPEQPDVILVVRPESWLTLAGANILLDETLCGWFLSDSLSAQGLRVEHGRDLVSLHPATGRSVHLIRVADAIIVATDRSHLARMYKAIRTRGLPNSPAPRFERLESATGDERVRVLARSVTVDRLLEFRETLEDLWGPDNLTLAKSLIPPFGGSDLLFSLSLGFGFELELESEVGPSSISRLVDQYGSLSRPELERTAHELASTLTDDAFALVAFEAPIGSLLGGLLEDVGFMDPETRKLLEEALAQVPSLDSIAATREVLDDVTRARTVGAFYRQPREPLEDEAEPGIALIAPVRAVGHLRGLLQDVRKEILNGIRDGSIEGIKDVKLNEEGGWTAFEFVVPDAAVEDHRVTKPGLAFNRKWLILTNYHPYLLRLQRSYAEEISQLADHPGLTTATAAAPDRLEAAALIEGETLFPYLDQSLSGWATKRTEPSATLYYEWAQEGAVQARQRGLKPGTEPFEAAIDRFVDHREQLALSERPEVLARFRQRVDEFRGLVQSVGLFLSQDPGTFRLRLRIDLASEPAPAR